MAILNVFDVADTQTIINRINKLTPESQPLWGKMSVDQMLAHLNVTYELVYEEDKFPKPNFFMKIIMRLFVKNIVVSDTPYQANSQTAPYFVMEGSKDFEAEKERLTHHILKTQELGADYFNNKASHSFGELSTREWNNLFYKHLDHHLKQFSL